MKTSVSIGPGELPRVRSHLDTAQAQLTVLTLTVPICVAEERTQNETCAKLRLFEESRIRGPRGARTGPYERAYKGEYEQTVDHGLQTVANDWTDMLTRV